MVSQAILLGSITSRYSGNEPALLPREGGGNQAYDSSDCKIRSKIHKNPIKGSLAKIKITMR